MKKTMRKALCLLLTLLMFVSIMGVNVFAAATSVKQYRNYLILGDSVASGYGLPSYEATVDPYSGTYLNEGVVHKGSYGQIVGDTVGAYTESRAHSGWRAIDYLDIMGYSVNAHDIDPTGELPDDFFISALQWIPNGRNNACFDGEQQKILNGIKRADLITLNLGCNDIFTYAQGAAMCTVSNRLGWKSLYDIPGTPGGVFNTFVSLGGNIARGNVKEVLSTYLNALNDGYKEFTKYLPKLVQVIKQLNPNVELCIVGMATPVAITTSKSNGSQIDIQSFFDDYTKKANTFMEALAEQYGCDFADVTGTSYYGTAYLDMSSLLTGSMLGVEVSGIKMVHPNPEGHAYMAQQILKVLPANDGKVKGGLSFLDVPNDAWYYSELSYCYNKGIAKGITDTSFAPNSNVTRAQLATFIYRLAGSPSIAGMFVPFVDLSINDYYPAIVWAYNNGVVKGFSETTFAPNSPVTRGQAVTMLARYAGVTAAGTSYMQFSDAGSIPAAYCGAVSWAVDNGIIKGYNDGTFRQATPLSRAQMVVILARYDQSGIGSTSTQNLNTYSNTSSNDNTFSFY